MIAPLPMLRDFSDRISPMVVKEMRQGLRTRFFTGALILFHVVLGLLMAAFQLDTNQSGAHEMFWLVIITAFLGILPLRAFNVLHAESKDGTMDMLVLTDISSFRIVWGKWVSLYCQSLLLACSLLPYLVARHQLGGVEIVRELLGLAVIVLSSGLVMAALTGFSSQRLLLIRLLMAFAVMVGAYILGVFGFLLACEKYAGGAMLTELFKLSIAARVSIFIGLPLFAAYLVYIFLCIGSARISLVFDSQAARKRVVALCVLVLLMAITFWLAFIGHFTYSKTFLWGCVPLLFVGILSGMDLVTEESLFFLPYRRNLMGRLFSSGWASGVLIFSFMGFSSILGLWFLFPAKPGVTPFSWVGMYATVLVPVCLPFFRSRSRLAQWWVVQLAMLAFGIMLAICGSFVSADAKIGLAYLSFITPVTSMFAVELMPYEERPGMAAIGIYTHAFWIIFALVLAMRQLRRESLADQPQRPPC